MGFPSYFHWKKIIVLFGTHIAILGDIIRHFFCAESGGKQSQENVPVQVHDHTSIGQRRGNIYYHTAKILFEVIYYTTDTYRYAHQHRQKRVLKRRDTFAIRIDSQQSQKSQIYQSSNTFWTSSFSLQRKRISVEVRRVIDLKHTQRTLYYQISKYLHFATCEASYKIAEAYILET